MRPDVDVTICTTIPEDRLCRELSRPVRFRRQDYEPGTEQRNCFEVDVDATRESYRRFLRQRPERLEAEKAFLEGFDGLISDIPALAVRAAASAGVRAFGLSNFTWDWILEPLLEGSDLEDVPALLAEDYSVGQLQVRLPLGAETSPFPLCEAAPLVGRLARQPAQATRRRLGLPLDEDRRLVLVCPGGWGAGDWPAIHVPGGEHLRYLLVGDLPITTDAPAIHLPHDLPPGLSFTDLVAAADVVLTKPGYGIASECALQRAALVAIERRGFREEAELLRGFRRLGPLSQMTLREFFAGEWEQALDEALESATSWRQVPRDGARQVAHRLLELLSLC